MNNKIIGLAYRHLKDEFKVETYALIYKDDNFLYVPLKEYENVYNDNIIDEIEKNGFKNINYWCNYITDIVREKKIVKK